MVRSYLLFCKKKCRIYAACGVSQTPNLYYRRRRWKMEDNQIIELYWQRNEEAIKETQAKYGSYC
jgi:hypothetical protein